jgi:hypothetical protein
MTHFHFRPVLGNLIDRRLHLIVGETEFLRNTLGGPSGVKIKEDVPNGDSRPSHAVVLNEFGRCRHGKSLN